jgi:hypothetical protein
MPICHVSYPVFYWLTFGLAYLSFLFGLGLLHNNSIMHSIVFVSLFDPAQVYDKSYLFLHTNCLIPTSSHYWVNYYISPFLLLLC